MHEFIREQKSIELPGNLFLDQQIKLNKIFFTQSCDFMADPTMFPNRRINMAVSILRDMLLRDAVTWEVTSQVNTLTYDVGLSGDPIRRVQRLRVLMPVDYAQQVIEDPVANMMKIADLASRARDYLSAQEYPGHINERALAYQAEAVNVIFQEHQKEGANVYLGWQHEAVLDIYPNGLQSLGKDHDYNDPRIGGAMNLN